MIITLTKIITNLYGFLTDDNKLELPNKTFVVLDHFKTHHKQKPNQ